MKVKFKKQKTENKIEMHTRGDRQECKKIKRRRSRRKEGGKGEVVEKVEYNIIKLFCHDLSYKIIVQYSNILLFKKMNSFILKY